MSRENPPPRPPKLPPPIPDGAEEIPTRARRITQVLDPTQIETATIELTDPRREDYTIEGNPLTGERFYKGPSILLDDSLEKIPDKVRDLVEFLNSAPFVSVRRGTNWEKVRICVLEFAVLKNHPLAKVFMEKLRAAAAECKKTVLENIYESLEMNIRNLMQKYIKQVVPRHKKLTPSIKSIEFDPLPEVNQDEEELWQLVFDLGISYRAFSIGERVLESDVERLKASVVPVLNVEVNYLTDPNRVGLRIHTYDATNEADELQVYSGVKVPEGTNIGDNLRDLVDTLNSFSVVSTRASSEDGPEFSNLESTHSPTIIVKEDDRLPYVEFVVLGKESSFANELRDLLQRGLKKLNLILKIPDPYDPNEMLSGKRLMKNEQIWRIEGSIENFGKEDKGRGGKWASQADFKKHLAAILEDMKKLAIFLSENKKDLHKKAPTWKA